LYGGKKEMLLDIIGPVIVGPSSSHTAGMARLGRAFRSLFNGKPDEVKFLLNSPLFATHRGHGTDRALVGGVLGMKESDPSLKQALEMAVQSGMSFCFEESDMPEAHPNTVKITGQDSDRFLSITGASVGGGEIRITSIDDFETSVSGKYPSLILLNADVPGALAQIVRLVSASDINISNLLLSRVDPYRREALCVIELDDEPDQDLIVEIKKLKVVRRVSYLEKLDVV
jgi:L-serine dehydratase